MISGRTKIRQGEKGSQDRVGAAGGTRASAPADRAALFAFADQFEQARCENVVHIDAPWKRSVAAIAGLDPGEPKALFTSPDCVVTYELPGWDTARVVLCGSVGYFPPAKDWGVSDGVRVCLDIESDDGVWHVVDARLRPGDADVAIRAPLDAQRGKPFRVVVRVVNDPGCHAKGDWVVWRWLGVFAEASAVPWTSTAACEAYGKGGATVEAVALCLAVTGREAAVLCGGEALELHLRVTAKQRIDRPIFGFTLNDRYGITILQANTFVYGEPPGPMSAGETRVVHFRFSLPYLRNGDFTVSPAVAEGTQDAHLQHHWVHDALVLRVMNPHPSRSLGGLVFVDDVRIGVE